MAPRESVTSGEWRAPHLALELRSNQTRPTDTPERGVPDRARPQRLLTTFPQPCGRSGIDGDIPVKAGNGDKSQIFQYVE